MKKILLLALVLVFALAGCSATPDPSGNIAAMAYRAELKAQSVGPLGEDFSRGVNDFGFTAASLLYGTDENLAVSPVSIELALAMTRAGAAGRYGGGDEKRAVPRGAVR